MILSTPSSYKKLNTGLEKQTTAGRVTGKAGLQAVLSISTRAILSMPLTIVRLTSQSTRKLFIPWCI